MYLSRKLHDRGRYRYENLPMLSKNENFIGNILDLFNNFAQSIHCGFERVPTMYVLDQK